MSDILYMNDAQLKFFKSSRFIGLLYRDKRTMDVIKNYFGIGEHAVEIGEGIDLDLLKDVYTPFLMEYNRRS